MNLVFQVKSRFLVQKLRSGKDFSEPERKEISDSFVDMGRDAIEPLSKCLSHGTARPTAIEILGRILNNKTLNEYLDLLGSPNPAVVSAVTSILISGTQYEAYRLLSHLGDSQTLRPRLEKVLTEKSESLSSNALMNVFPELTKESWPILFRLLEQSKDAATATGLLKMAKHEDWWVRSNATRVLANHTGDEVVRGLTERLSDENKGVRLEAVKALHQVADKSSIPALVETLRDNDLKVQTGAIDALCHINDVGAVKHLLTLLTDDSEYIRRAAVEVLNAVATTEAIQDLVRALRDEDWWVRVRSADALGTLGGEMVVEAIIGLMSDEDEFIRRHAVEILNAIPDQRAVDALILGLNDSDWWVQERSIDALGATGDERAVEPLIQLIAHDRESANLCARALGDIGDARAIGPLIELLRVDHEEIIKEAKAALQKIGGTNLTPEQRVMVESAVGRTLSARARKGAAPMQVQKASGAMGSHPVGGTGADPGHPMAAGNRSDLSSNPLEKERAAGASSDSDQLAGINFNELPEGMVLLSRYKILRKVGRGGFGAVYLVDDSVIEDQVILKILNPQLSVDGSALKRFVQELKITRKITHKNVIRIYDFLELGSSHAVSMEYFSGQDLWEVLEREKTIEIRRGLGIITQVCDGLFAAHAEGVVHRDIKPANILVGHEDEVKVLDFGLASANQTIGSRLTKSGLLIGTPEYMAPEQISDEEVDHRADIYSVGILMYEMFSGNKPFTAETPVKILFQHLEGEAPPLAKIIPGFSQGVSDLVSLSMSKAREDRPADVQELKTLIEKELETLPVSSE